MLALCLLVNSAAVFAQNTKALDKKIKEARFLMYKNPDEGIRMGNVILKEAKDNVDYKIRAYKLISDAYSSKRDYQKSLEYVTKANQILDLSTDELLKISVVNRTAIQYHQLKIYDKSIQYLDQAEQLMLDYPVKDSVLFYLGSNYLVRGFIYKEKLNCDIAIEFFDKGVNLMLLANTKFANNAISIAKYNKGNCYILAADYEKAKENFKISIQYAKKDNATSLTAFALKGLAQVCTLEDKYAEAITLLQEATEMSKGINDLILNQEIYKGLSENYLALNKWQQHKEYHILYLKTQKLIKENERKSVSDSLLEKKSELHFKLKKVLSKFYVFYSILLLVLLSVILLVICSIKSSKQRIIKLQNKITLLQNPKSI